MVKGLTLLLTLLTVSMAVRGQECSSGTQVKQRLTFKKSVVVSHPGGRWSSTKPRYGRRKVSRSLRDAKIRGGGQMDMPLERCAILAMTGVGVGYLGTQDDYWIGVPAVVVAVAMPFPGQSISQFKSKGLWKQKLLGVFGMTVSYAVGLGIGANMKHTVVE